MQMRINICPNYDVAFWTTTSAEQTTATGLILYHRPDRNSPGSGQSDLFPGLRVLVLDVEIDRGQRADGVLTRFLQGAFREQRQHRAMVFGARLKLICVVSFSKRELLHAPTFSLHTAMENRS